MLICTLLVALNHIILKITPYPFIEVSLFFYAQAFCFHYFMIINNATMNILVHMHSCIAGSKSSGSISRSGIAGSKCK